MDPCRSKYWGCPDPSDPCSVAAYESIRGVWTAEGAGGADGGESAGCIDRESAWVSNGSWYKPISDPCIQCVCRRGRGTSCKAVMCLRPNCVWERVEGHCCQFRCLDNSTTTPTNSTLSWFELGLASRFDPVESEPIDQSTKHLARLITSQISVVVPHLMNEDKPWSRVARLRLGTGPTLPSLCVV